jgi:hypothetical protein
MNRTAIAALLAGLVAMTGCRSADQEQEPSQNQSAQAQSQQAPTPTVELTGVWERNDGAVFRLAESKGMLVGYRSDDSYFGCRVSLAVDGAALAGGATFTRRRDEHTPLATGWKLSVQPDGSLGGQVEAIDVDDDHGVVGRTWIEHSIVKI